MKKKLLNTNGSKLSQKVWKLLTKSLNAAAREQDLQALKKRLEEAVPDISNQYTCFKIDSEYLEAKVRNMHAFQISLIEPVINEFKESTIVDIGDSSGTHHKYLTSLYSNNGNIKCLSVNLDKEAVNRIKSKGFEAIHARAEDLPKFNIKADIITCFETLEHLLDPCHFLHNLSMNEDIKYLVITVPFVRKTGLGLHPIRRNLKEDFGAEKTHVFELCPEDFKLLCLFSGWRVDYEKIYFQYPKSHLLRFTKPIWKKFDFEGFYGVRLVRENKWSKKYLDW